MIKTLDKLVLKVYNICRKRKKKEGVMRRSKLLDKELSKIVDIAQKAMSIYYSQWNYATGFNYREFERFVYQNLDPHNIYNGEELWGMRISLGDIVVKWDMERVILEAPGYFRRLRKDSRAFEVLSKLFYTLWIGA